MKKIQKDVENMLANQIRNLMSRIQFPFVEYYTEEEKIDCIQKLSLLTNELLSGPGTEKKFEKLANKSFVNGQDNKEKYQVFKMLRNLLIHFPFFEKWEDIYINEQLLSWNEKKGGQIKKFFKENENKNLKYVIFMNYDGIWKEEWEVDIVIPKIYPRKKIYLKDFLSIEDAIWTFCIIDYYLQSMGYRVNYDCSVSL